MSLTNRLMFAVHKSKFGFDETVAAVTAAAETHGWTIPMAHDLQETYQSAGYEEMTRVQNLYFCYPDGGYRILKADENKPMAAMLPLGVSIYEDQSGDVFISAMNLDGMSMMFGGEAKAVLKENSARFAGVLKGIADPVDGLDADIDLDQLKSCGGRSCLGCGLGCGVGCLSLLTFFGAMLAVVAFVLFKVMPKIMPKMMAKMTGEMEKAGVQPPCDKIILDHLDEQEDSEDAG